MSANECLSVRGWDAGLCKGGTQKAFRFGDHMQRDAPKDLCKT